MSFILLYVTHENMEEAEKIVSHLLKEKLIACANFFPIKSSYFWKGNVESSEEVVSILKTGKQNWNKVESEIGRLHSYKVPCIIKIDAEANQKFEDWVKNPD